MATPISTPSHTSSSATRRPRTMGASRDFTSSAENSGRATALLDRTQVSPLRRAEPHRRTDDAPRGPERREAGRKNGRRLGSRQVVSVRGRRTQPIRDVGLLPKVSAIAIVLLITGIVVAMWLSGVATQQTFRINQLVAQESQLENQLETLNRDLQTVSSSAELTRRADEMGMVIPEQPGILIVEENGEITESRPVGDQVSPMIDINGEPVRPGQASSDPNETDELTDNLQAVPEGEQILRAPNDGIAPYANGGNNRPAPAPAPEPERPAPAPAEAPAEAPAQPPAGEQ